MTAALGYITPYRKESVMETLLIAMLVHYYKDSKRSTNARITRKMDLDIRMLSRDKPVLEAIVRNAKNVAEAQKQHDRREAKKLSTKVNRARGRSVIHVPCRKVDDLPPSNPVRKHLK